MLVEEVPRPAVDWQIHSRLQCDVSVNNIINPKSTRRPQPGWAKFLKLPLSRSGKNFRYQLPDSGNRHWLFGQCLRVGRCLPNWTTLITGLHRNARPCPVYLSGWCVRVRQTLAQLAGRRRSLLSSSKHSTFESDLAELWAPRALPVHSL